ncbi:lysyl oxidase family protein [Pyxidicoccus xibeiensis]|uniref:lysyl oxidase family protein n=1 Tax=Pyxidicoccus xibeiensis TaxID=2906759 RepID=UPI0020A83888|nr:lysyl oxidase family protein [Pyxidicoccus xibeiensis]MCP3136981.1 FG-GAP-like repeat-containing protein [Pyxidicoccus xibeiensis]
MYLLRKITLSSLLAMLLCACPGGPDPIPDAGVDAGEPDAGKPDAGEPDAGEPDAGEPDAGEPDAGEPDAGAPDAGAPDAGPPDAGPGDAGPVLSEVPLWEVKNDPTYTAGCFGRSVAMGDVNGDGQKDLVVAAPPCLTFPRDPGRVYLFAGEAPFFIKSGISTVMDWRNTNTRTSGNQMVVSTGDVDGDAYADVLVSGQYGALVYKGRADLSQVFAEPLFLSPGGGVYNNAVLSDVDGDGLDDLVSLRGTQVSVFRATPGAETAPFTLVPRTNALFSSSVRRAGDLNGDGAEDLILINGTSYGLFLGCKPDSTMVCDGFIARSPTWVVQGRSMSFLPDVNDDGMPERFVGPGGGTVDLHLSDAATVGGYSTAPVWTVMGDPVFSQFGNPVVGTGDMDGDGKAHDFVVGSDGRLYFFSPAQGVSAELKPVWSWPRGDSLPSNYEGFMRFSVLAPGDMDGNGYTDLVVGMAPPVGLVGGPAGRVVILGGGAVPSAPAKPPHLPEVKACGLELDPVNGKPDLTVDADVLARSVYVENRFFAPDACEVLEGCVAGGGQRRLLRFSTSIVNLGKAAATVPNVEQRPDLYVFDECHGHDHLTNFAGYALRDAEGRDVVQGRKQGFYLVDYHRQCSDAAPYFLYSQQMGISAGWSDIYVADIPCQWIDITDLTDGTYTLRVGVDEQDIIDEEPTLPNEAKLNVRIEGSSVTVVP